MKRKGFLLTSLIAAVLLVPSASFAEDAAEVDIFSGSEIAETGMSDVTALTGNMSYNMRTGCFCYALGADADTEVTSNLADGMVTGEAVWISCGSSLSLKLYRNGELVENPDFNEITEQGAYRVFAIKPNGTGTNVFDFTIVNSATSLIHEYEMPDGFAISEVSYNGEDITASSYRVSMEEEGNYEILYSCTETGIYYELDTRIDRTSPTLLLPELDGEDSHGGPVDISDLAEDVSLTVYYNGAETPVDSLLDEEGRLDQIGEYELVLEDEAGNITEYTFEITMYFTLSGIAAIAVFLLLVIAGAVDLIRTRRHYIVR